MLLSHHLVYIVVILKLAVNDNDPNTITGETVYVGLYPPNEGMGYTYTGDVDA